jgi:protein-S-isoprenylcysteine O-methyltransferase Ste14
VAGADSHDGLLGAICPGVDCRRHLQRPTGTEGWNRSAFPVAWLIGVIAFVIVSRLVPAQLWRPITVDIHWLIVVGVVVLAAATAFTIWARIVLGTMWTSAPVSKMITYCVPRDPMP